MQPWWADEYDDEPFGHFYFDDDDEPFVEAKRHEFWDEWMECMEEWEVYEDS